jgi:hypothetical protein
MMIFPAGLFPATVPPKSEYLTRAGGQLAVLTIQ